MATLTTLRPDGTGTVSAVVNELGLGALLELSVDDDPDSPTTTDYIRNGNDTTGDKTAFLLMSATDADFATMTTLQVDAHIALSAFSDDTCTLFARMYQSDETTALTDEMQVATQAQSGLRSVAFTNVSAGDKTTWDGARLRLRWAYSRSMGADGGQLRVTAVELDGTYSAALPNVDKSDSDSATVTDAASLSAAVAGLDAAVVSDAASLSATIASADSATATDNDGVVLETFAVDGSDSATVTDVFDSLAVAVTGTDNPTVSEAGTIAASAVASDSATVSDAGSVASAFTPSDSAAVTDNNGTLSADVAGADSVTLTESAAVTVEAAVSDSATVSDSGSLTSALVSADSATITEMFDALVATITGLDTGTLGETGTAGEEVAKAASDSATLSESGSIEESIYRANERGRSGAAPGRSGGRASSVSASKGRIEVSDDGRSGT